MQALRVVPTIYYFDTFKEFNESFALTDKDLIVTNSWLYEPYMKPLNTGANVIFQEKYGAGEPTDVMIDAIVKDAKQFEYDRIIAVGGGTVIDICKVLSLDVPDQCVKLFTGEVEPKKVKELIIVPTTCGTGSEVTNVTVVALTSLNTKKGLASDETYASAAVLIPESMQGLPDKVFSTSSIDALIHAVESFLSPKASPFTETFSETAIDRIVNGYLGIVRAGNTKEARNQYLRDFALASNYAGIAFGNAGCGPVHAMSYAVGGAFHVAHGESNYLHFTDVLKKYQEKNPDGEKLVWLQKKLAALMNCAQKDAFDRLDDLLGTLIEKKPLKDYGMTESQIEEFADMTLENQQRLLQNQYVVLSRDDIIAIYRSAF